MNRDRGGLDVQYGDGGSRTDLAAGTETGVSLYLNSALALRPG